MADNLLKRSVGTIKSVQEEIDDFTLVEIEKDVTDLDCKDNHGLMDWRIIGVAQKPDPDFSLILATKRFERFERSRFQEITNRKLKLEFLIETIKGVDDIKDFSDVGEKEHYKVMLQKLLNELVKSMELFDQYKFSTIISPYERLKRLHAVKEQLQTKKLEKVDEMVLDKAKRSMILGVC